MTFAEKLQAIANAKQDIRLAINSKGIFVDKNLPFLQYGDKLRQIEQTLSGDGFGAVIGPPDGDYYLRLPVYLYNNYLANPRFYAAPTILGPYIEILEQPLMVLESTTLYVFASDESGKGFTSIYKFILTIKGTEFEESAVLPELSDFLLISSDKLGLQVNINKGLAFPDSRGAFLSVTALTASEYVTITRR